jgi:hypothetical protein
LRSTTLVASHTISAATLSAETDPEKPDARQQLIQATSPRVTPTLHYTTGAIGIAQRSVWRLPVNTISGLIREGIRNCRGVLPGIGRPEKRMTCRLGINT